MAKTSRREFLRAIPAGLAAARLAHAQNPAGSGLQLWYTQPAAQWTEALPLGNGRLWAMVFGGVPAERIQLNEDTLWSGHPRDWNNPEASKHLPVVRRLVLEEEKYVEAGAECRKMQGPFNESYLPLGNLRLTFEAAEGVSGYRRELDLDAAIASVFYRSGGADFEREVFVSAPDQVVVVRLTTTRPEGMSFEVTLDSPVRSSAESAGKDALILRGKAPAHTTPDYHGGAVVYDGREGLGMHFASLLRAIPEGGSVEAESAILRVRGARAVTLLLTAATGFRGFEGDPDLPAAAVADICRATLERAHHKSYAALRKAHTEDHQRLFRRVTLDLGAGPGAQKPTDERLRSFSENHDQGLAALYFQYGRYLLIASSRPGGQPANLQGLWNELVKPPWSSNWTANINVQMNYWPAETCNLAECHEPLFDLIEGLSKNGRSTAKVNYGAAGWVSHHNVDLWRQSAPVGEGEGSPTWANWPMSGPWFCAHLWEHYLFTGDGGHLKRVYPIMKGAAEFCLDWLLEDGHGHLTTCPSLSTENTFRAPDGRTAQVSAGCTMDMALIGELFSNCIEAGRLLQVDEEFAIKLGKARAQLIPFQIGKYGQLQEWSKDFEESEPGQRHMSHMYPLFPGSQITPRKTPALAKAARTSLERRLAAGGAYTGWSRAWAINFWARLEDGGRAYESLAMLFQHSTGPNLFDTHPAGNSSIFQIDGNFGGTAAIAEMLLQSHAGEICLLPALPSAWGDGSVQGLAARGGVTVGLQWDAGRLTRAVLRSKVDHACLVRYDGKQIQLQLTGGRDYVFNGDLQPFAQAEISNDIIRATLYLPDPGHGYYRGTRFDWSGVIAALEYQGHDYFGPWFEHYDPKMHDAISGPVEEFRTNEAGLGYAEAKPGDTFIRIGVGVVRKPYEPKYDFFHTYDIVDSGRWTVRRGRGRVEFTHTLADRSGYAYVYRKTVSLEKGKPLLTLEHSLKNTGHKVIETSVYDHNFLVLDGQSSGPDFVVRFPFEVRAARTLGNLAETRGKEIVYLRELEKGESVFTELEGFGESAADYDIIVENRKVGAGVRITGDRPLSKLVFWSIRTTVCPEAYVQMRIDPGREFKWRIAYNFYTLPKPDSVA